MDGIRLEPRGVTRALVAFFVLLLAGSLRTASLASPRAIGERAGSALGRAGFAYLTGLRTFAAAVLWNRIEPVFHEYYSGVPLQEQRYMVPTLYLVTVLDPQFVQAYYVSSYIVARAVGYEQGIALAREGVKNNPGSGILRANLAQLLFLDDKDANREEILMHIARGLDERAAWLDDEERYEGYAMMGQMLKSLGHRREADAIETVLKRMRDAGIGHGDHDHDGDGVQDH